MLNQVRLPGMGRVTSATWLGWAVTEPLNGAVNLFDHDLLPVARLALPSDDRHAHVAATAHLIAVGDNQHITVVNHSGAVQWRKRWTAAFDFAGDGILWVRPAATKELVAVQAATGDEIHRIPLPGPDAAWFLHRPGDAWTGIALLEPDLAPAFVVRLEADRIVLRPLAAEDLAAFSPSGDRYLTMGPDGFLSIRDLTTQAVAVACHLDDLPEIPAAVGSPHFMEYAVFLTDELVLIHPNLPDESRAHLVLSARTLRYRSQVRYPGRHSPGSIYDAPGLSLFP